MWDALINSSGHRRRALLWLALTVLGHLGVLVLARHSAPRWPQIDQSLPTLDVRLLTQEPEPEPAPPTAAPVPVAKPATVVPPRTRARPARPVRPPAGAPVESVAATDAASPPSSADAFVAPPSASAVPESESGSASESGPASGSATSAVVSPAADPAPAERPPAAPRYGRALLEPARSGRLRYALHYGDYTEGGALAQMSLSFNVDERGGYRLWTEGHAIGLTAWFYSGSLTQVSHGQITQDGLQPSSYDETRGTRPERHLVVDAATGVVVLPDRRTVPSEPGMQDRLSTLLQLSLFARTQPERFEPGKTLTIPEMNFGGVEPVGYRSEGYVTLPTPLGALQAIHLRRLRPGKPDEPTIEIWLGYDQAMLPVRVRVTDRNGRVLDQLIKELP